MSFLTKLVERAQNLLLPLGGWGLFGAAVLDSSFLTLPNVVDLWVISLCALRPARMPLYVLVATAGSVLGCSILYYTVRKGEEIFLERKGKGAALGRARHWVEKYEAWTLLVVSMLPPPTPLKLFVTAAGLVKCHFGRFVLALLIGRTIRYSAEGLFGVYYGNDAWELLIKRGPLVTGIVALVVLAVFLRRKLWPKPSVSGAAES